MRREAFELFGRDSGKKAILRNRGDRGARKGALPPSGEEHMHLLAARFPKIVAGRCIIVAARCVFILQNVHREVSPASYKGLLPFGQFSRFPRVFQRQSSCCLTGIISAVRPLMYVDDEFSIAMTRTFAATIFALLIITVPAAASLAATDNLPTTVPIPDEWRTCHQDLILHPDQSMRAMLPVVKHKHSMGRSVQQAI